ncbi:MAG: ABC transporter ATP-binding protein [Cyanobacteria bacterium P01_A01_bin.123]
MGYLKKFLYVFSGHRKQLLILLGVFLTVSVLEAFGIGMIGSFMELANDPNSLNNSSFFAALYKYLNFQNADDFVIFTGVSIVIIFIVKSIGSLAGKAYTIKVIFTQRAAVQKRLFQAYLLAPYEFHLSRNTADFINKITAECFRFANLISLPIVELCSKSIVVIVLVGLMANADRILFLFTLGILAPVFLVFHLLSKYIKRWGQLASLLRAQTVKTVGQGLGGLKETRIIGCEDYFQIELSKNVNQEARLETLFRTSQAIPRILIETLLVIVIIGFICLSKFILGQDFQSAVSTIGIFAVASFRLVPATSQITQSLNKLRNSAYTLDILYLDLKEIESQRLRVHSLAKSIISKSAGQLYPNVPALTFHRQLELKDIIYRYPTAQTVSLDRISLTIRQGESIGLIGKSGAGKTTLVDVLLALLKPEGGDILVDDLSIYENLDGWKNLVGYIPQSIFLLDDTIERNIAFGMPDKNIDLDQLWYAIKAAQLEELIQELPDGIKTSVGERGVRLSGGQRQRIGIARALYHQREILVLDEATSALDNETEQLISESIKALAGSKTLIIIAHRLTTIEHCDRIYVLDKGQIARSGKYQDVVFQ